MGQSRDIWARVGTRHDVAGSALAPEPMDGLLRGGPVPQGLPAHKEVHPPGTLQEAYLQPCRGTSLIRKRPPPIGPS